MSFQDDPDAIIWKVHLAEPPGIIYKLLATNEGRARWWAEFAIEKDWKIEFRFSDGTKWSATIVEQVDPTTFKLVYVGGSLVTFDLVDDDQGATILTLTDRGVPDADRCEVIAGWVSVLMNLKAVVNMGIDLRNHDPNQSWQQGFVGN